MNRRKLFGILAAAPVAANAKFTDKPLSTATVNNELAGWNGFRIALSKPYSYWDYNDLYRSFEHRYLKNKHNLKCDDLVCSFNGHHNDLVWDRATYFDKLALGTVDTGVATRMSEIRQAFADACLNGEIPGVWWE